jgi:copper chaperone CopZ
MDTTLSIPDMTCGSCVRHVQNVLKDVPGIQSSDFNLRQRHVTLKTAGTDAVAEARAKLDDEGYGSTIIAK